MDMHELAGTTGIMREPGHHDETYDKVIDALGGLDAVKPYIPYGMAELETAYKKDHNFNTLPLKKWDEAGGYSNGSSTSMGGKYDATGKGLWPLLRQHGITWSTSSWNVCLLKRAAERMVLEAAHA